MKKNYKLLADKIRIVVISSMIPFLDKFPVLETILKKNKHSSRDWDFFMTVAGLGLYYLIDETDYKKTDKILEQLSEAHKEMPKAISDFVRQSAEWKEEDFGTRVGYWVLSNIEGSKHKEEECGALATAIGDFLAKAVKDFSN